MTVKAPQWRPEPLYSPFRRRADHCTRSTHIALIETEFMTASPLATGGAGPNLEAEVAVHYLAALLVGGAARGLTNGRVVDVLFQRASLGSPLDDIVIKCETPAGVARLDVQVKRTLSFTPGDEEFGAVLLQCWKTMSLPGAFGPAHRMAVAVEIAPKKTRTDYVRVALWAQASPDAADFFRRLEEPGLSSGPMRTFVHTVRELLTTQIDRHNAGIGSTQSGVSLEDVSDERLWTLLKQFLIIDFDLTLGTQSRDRASAIELLRRAVPDESPVKARALYEHLLTVVAQGTQTAGGFTETTLRDMLRRNGVELAASSSARSDIRRLDEHSDLVLDAIEEAIATVTLDRTDLADTLVERMNEGSVTFLTGVAGAGKSALLRRAALTRRSEGPVLAFSGDRITDVQGWNGLALLLGVGSSLPDLLTSVAGAARPCLVIDGVDRVMSAGGRLAINDVLAQMAKAPPNPDGTSRWSVVVTTRRETLNTVLGWLRPRELTTNREPIYLEVPELNDDEAEALSRQLPRLAPILQAPRVLAVARNPYFLRAIEQSIRVGTGAAASAPATSWVTEADVMRVWWEDLIGQGGTRDRQEALHIIGERALAQRSRRLTGVGVPPSTLESLEQDGVLKRDPNSDTYWFGHDIIEEWVESRVLARQEDALQFLKSIGDPFWAAGALEIHAAASLETAGASAWLSLVERAESTNSTWTDVIVSAPLRSARIRSILPQIEGDLLAFNGKRLTTLLRSARTKHTRRNESLEALMASVDMTPEARESLLLDYALPDGVVWPSVMQWLVPHLPSLPVGARDEASHVMLTWQRLLWTGFPFRREVGEAALAWMAPPQSPPKGLIVRYGRSDYFHRLRDIVAFSADAVPERIPNFLRDLVAGEREDCARWLGDGVFPGLMTYTPAAFTDFALDVLVPRWREREPVARTSTTRFARSAGVLGEDEEWQHLQLHLGGAFLGASHKKGPFLTFLNTNEHEALRLISILVNRATMSNLRNDAFHSNASPVDIVLRDASTGLTQRLSGDARIFQWYRPNGGAPFPVLSALMALEVWMEQQIESGREPEELFRTVLAPSTSVATLGVCVGVALAYPDQCLAAAASWVSLPLVWIYDIARLSTDRMGHVDVGAMMGISDPAAPLLRERDTRPQRRVDIRSLIPHYLLRQHEPLGATVLKAVRDFVTDLSPLAPAQVSDQEAVREYVEYVRPFAALGDPTNYRYVRLSDGRVAIEYVLTPELEARQARAMQNLEAQSAIFSLHLWADRSSAGVPHESMTASDAMARAQELLRGSPLHNALKTEDSSLLYKVEAIVGTAAAILAIPLRAGAPEPERIWARAIIRDLALQIPDVGDPHADYARVGLLKRLASGLIGILLAGEGDADVRVSVLRLAIIGESRVADQVYASLPGLWDAEIVLCKNLVALAFGDATERRGWLGGPHGARSPDSQRRRDEIETNLRAGRLPDSLSLGGAIPPQTSASSTGVDSHGADIADFYPSLAMRGLRAVPLHRVADGSEREWVVKATVEVLDIVARTYQAVSGSFGSQHPFGVSLGRELGGWLAQLITDGIDEGRAKKEILARLEASWPATAELTEGVLLGLATHSLTKTPIPAQALSLWRDIARWAIPENALVPGEARRLPQDHERALSAFVHVHYDSAIFTESWNNAPALVDVYGRWVESVGHSEWGFRALVRFLRAGGQRIDPVLQLRWITSCVAGVGARTARVAFWSRHEMGEATAQLLAALWRRSSGIILADAEASTNLASLLDELASCGIPIARATRSLIERA